MKLLFAFVFLLTGASAHAGNSAGEGQVTSGVSHTCTLNQSKVQCWGNNQFGQSKVPELRNPKMVSAGYNHTCALDEEGVKCWGENKFGQTNVPPLKNPRYVAAGKRSSCAIDDDGVKCWWYNKEGESQPPNIRLRPEMVSVGEDRACALVGGDVTCWGKRERGYMRKLQNPKLVSVGKQVCVLDELGVACDEYESAQKKWVAPQSVVAGPNGQCVQDQGKITCWSEDTYFRFDPWAEYQPPPFENLASFSLGQDHMCGRDQSGIQCWGYGYTNIPKLKNPRLLRAGHRTACAADDEGVKCWGLAAKGMNERMPAFQNLKSLSMSSGDLCAIDDQGPRCISGDKRFNLLPPPGVEGAREIMMGRSRICTSMADSIVCWVQMGQMEPYAYSIQNPEVFTFGPEGVCAVAGNQLTCWKSAEKDKPKSYPIGIRAIASGEYSTYLVNDQDQLMSFYNGAWIVGRQPLSLSGTRALSVGERHVCALDNGGVKCHGWGNDTRDQEIQKVPPLPDPEAIASGSYFACALGSGKVECWGQEFERVREIPAIR